MLCCLLEHNYLLILLSIIAPQGRATVRRREFICNSTMPLLVIRTRQAKRPKRFVTSIVVGSQVDVEYVPADDVNILSVYVNRILTKQSLLTLPLSPTLNDDIYGISASGVLYWPISLHSSQAYIWYAYKILSVSTNHLYLHPQDFACSTPLPPNSS